MDQPEDTGRTGLVVVPVLVGALSLLALQLVVRIVIVPQAYWWEDDFFHLAAARTHGLSADFVVSDYNDHLEILPNVLSWFLTRVTDSAWAPAAVLILLLSTTASVAVLLLLRELFGDRPAILVPFAAYLFSPLLLVSVTWLAASVEALPMHVALCGTAWAMLRLRRTGHLRWLGVSLALHLVGLLAWEKGVLVLPFVLALQVLVADAGEPVRTRLAGLRRQWYAWTAHAVLLVGYVVLYLVTVDGSERKPVHGVDYLDAIRTMLFDVLVPGLFGAPWHRGDAENTLYPSPGIVLAVVAAVVLALLVVGSVVRNRAAAGLAWLLAGGYVAVDVGLMLWGRAGFLELVARDPRYVTDAVPVVLVCATAAFLGPREELQEVATWRGLTPSATVAVVLAAASLLTTFQLVPVLRHDYARSYVESVLARADPDPGTSIVDTPVPTLVSGNVDHRDLLLAMGRRATFNQPSTRMLAFDADARLVPVAIPFPLVQRTGPRRDCGWPVHDLPVGIVSVPPDPGRGLVLRVGTLSGVAGTLTARVGDLEQTVLVAPGLNAAYFYLDKPSGEVVVTFDSDGDRGLCVTDVLLGQPASAP
jgi:hypothetical protein